MKNKLTLLVMTLFNLGDEGKVLSFFGRAAKKLKKDEKIIQQNLGTLELELTNLKDDYADALQDSIVKESDSWTNLEMDQLATNASQDDFMETYFSRIDAAEKATARLKERFEEEIKEKEEQIEATKESLAKVQAYIKKLEEEEVTSTEA